MSELVVDYVATWAFLRLINDKASQDNTRWKFAFVSERAGDVTQGVSEHVNATFQQFMQIASSKNNDGWGCFLEHKTKYIRLPGLYLVEDQSSPLLIDAVTAQFVLKSIENKGEGDNFPAKDKNNVTKLNPEGPALLGLEHRAKLEARGLTAQTISEAGIHTITGKKAVCELLHRSAWDQGPVMSFPHHVDATGGYKTLRLLADKPSAGKASTTISSVWTHGPDPFPYLPLSCIRDARYTSSEPIYWVFDEVDALVIAQRGDASIGGESVDAFFDSAHEAQTGEVRLHACITDNITIKGLEHVVLYYRRVSGRKKHDAYRLVSHLKTLGATKCAVVDVTQGTLAGCANDDIAWTRLLSTKRMPTAEELDVGYPTLQDALGEGLPSTKIPLLIPREFEVKENGEILRYKENQTPNGPVLVPERVTRNPMFVRRVVEDYVSQERQYEIAFQVSGEWRTRLVPVPQLLSRRELGKLAHHGMHASDHNAAGVVAWLHEFCELNDLERRFEVIPSYRRTGWHTQRDGTLRYIFPGHGDVVFDDGDGRKPILDALRVRGDMAVQLEYTKRMMDGGLATCAAIGTAFAAPLLEILDDAPNVVTHFFGQTTQGKTATQRVASAIFGDPEKMKLKGNTTATGLEYTLATCNGILTPIDEITSADAKTREDFAYMIYDGKGKTRGAKSGGTRETQAWRACVVSTAEVPFTEDSARAGAQARVFNIKFTGIAGFEKADIGALYGLTAKHHGHLVRPYAAFLASYDHDLIRAEFAELQETYAQRAAELGLNVRFALSAALLALGLRMAARAFPCFDPEKEHEMFKLLGSDELSSPTNETTGERGLAVLIDHLQAHPGELVPYNDPETKGVVTARKRADGHLCIIPERLKTLLTAAGLSSRMVREEWKDKGWLLEGKGGRTDTVQRVGKQVKRFIVLDGNLLYDNANDPVVPKPET